MQILSDETEFVTELIFCNFTQANVLPNITTKSHIMGVKWKIVMSLTPPATWFEGFANVGGVKIVHNVHTVPKRHRGEVSSYMIHMLLHHHVLSAFISDKNFMEKG